MAHTKGPGRYSGLTLPRVSSLAGKRKRAEARAATKLNGEGYTKPGSMNVRKVGR